MLIQLLVKSSDRAVSTMPSIPPRAAARHDTFGRLPEPATSSQTEVAQRPRGQRRLERRPAYFRSAERTWLKEDDDAESSDCAGRYGGSFDRRRVHFRRE